MPKKENEGDGGQSNEGKNQPDTQAELNELKGKIEKGELIPATRVEEIITTRISEGKLFLPEAYTGLQRTIAKKDEAIAESGTKLADTQLKIAELTTAKATLEAEKANLTKTKEDADMELAALKAGAARAKLIFQEFSDLAAFEAASVLPDAGSEEELRPLLENFRKAIASQVDNALTKYKAGGGQTPPPPIDKKKATSDALLKEAQNAIRKGDRVLYQEKYDAYIASLPAEEK